MMIRFGLFLAAVAAASAGAAQAPVRTSTYTKVGDSVCTMIEENQETFDWTGSCPGAGGYSLEWSISDLRDDLTVIRGSARTDLQIPSIVAKGPFDSVGETIEWRGPEGGPPDVLVVRVYVARPDGSDDGGRLAVARLGDKPCLVAVVPVVKDQNEKARAIADGPLPKCLEP